MGIVRYYRNTGALLLVLTSQLLSTAVLADTARQLIRVGLYPYPPYVFASETNEFSGMTTDLIALFNQAQQDYQFVPFPVSPKRRYQAFRRGEYDMMFFESPQWGWQNMIYAASEPYYSDGEVYVALKDKDRGQHYFSDLESRRLVGILGFHYGFAGLNADEHYLQEHFRIMLTWSNEKNLSLLRQRHADIAIMSKAYLNYYFALHPQEKDDFLISEHYDNFVVHYVLIRPSFTPGAEYISQLMKRLKHDGRLQALFAAYNIPECSAFSREKQAGQIQEVCLW